MIGQARDGCLADPLQFVWLLKRCSGLFHFLTDAGTLGFRKILCCFHAANSDCYVGVDRYHHSAWENEWIGKLCAVTLDPLIHSERDTELAVRADDP